MLFRVGYAPDEIIDVTPQKSVYVWAWTYKARRHLSAYADGYTFNYRIRLLLC